MQLGVLKEIIENENRVSITPDIAYSFINKGVKVVVESGAGEASGFTDAQYTAIGCVISSKEAVFKSQIIASMNFPLERAGLLTSSNILLCNMRSFRHIDKIKEIAQRGIEAYDLGLITRISRAQSMDVLSSQSNLAGYQAIIQAAYHSNIVFPMMMTSAGTVPPVKIFVMGVGVAGLQAIATGKRLGGMVSAYDIRIETKEQVESLGARFLQLGDNQDREILINHLSKQDIVVTAASTIGGKSAPILIDEETLEKCKRGAVVIDLGIEDGGNCCYAKVNEIIEKNGVKIIGIKPLNFVSSQASQLFAKNIYNFLIPWINSEAQTVDFNYSDEIIQSTLVCKDRQVIHSLLRNL